MQNPDTHPGLLFIIPCVYVRFYTVRLIFGSVVTERGVGNAARFIYIYYL